MPKKSKTLCVDDLRHAEYYGMQGNFDELYQKSQNGEVFENLMDLILSRDNITCVPKHQSEQRQLHGRNRQKEHHRYWESNS